MKILTIIGARPQFIKASAISRELVNYPEVEEVILHTGQHYDTEMSKVFFEELKVPTPRYNLNINNLSHGAMTGNMLIEIERILLKESPDYVLVYGDTNSTLAGALAASKLNIRVVHVEAGLRSHNKRMPEEWNRILTDRISTLLFCPTELAVNNLIAEGFQKFDCHFFKSGDVMLDNAIYYSNLMGGTSRLIEDLKLKTGNYLLCTFHRAENTDNHNRLTEIIQLLNELSKKYEIIVPMHPRTFNRISDWGYRIDFRIVKPQGYLGMLELIMNSLLIITDSGGLQKEAYFFKKFCITLREETEWKELVEINVNVLAGTDLGKVLDVVKRVNVNEFPVHHELYGNGRAAKFICEKLIELT